MGKFKKLLVSGLEQACTMGWCPDAEPEMIAHMWTDIRENEPFTMQHAVDPSAPCYYRFF
jgi:hypothetical protein